MNKVLSPGGRIAVLLAAVGFTIAAILLTQTIPAVEGLGDKVRLPIFHGGSTWVNLATFTLMGLFGLAYLLFSRPDLYRWAVGFRWVSAPLWVLNSMLGVIAAISTWDFTGSQQSPLAVIREDPRLTAQFQLLMALIIVIALDAMLESRKTKAFLDVAFVALMWWLLGGVFTDPQAKALHPDNPVLNSGSAIQVPFFSIVGCLFVAAVLVAWLVRDHITRTD